MDWTIATPEVLRHHSCMQMFAAATEDARASPTVPGFVRRGIDAFAFGIGNGPFSQLDRVFGEQRALRISRVEMLPQRVVQLYAELKR